MAHRRHRRSQPAPAALQGAAPHPGPALPAGAGLLLAAFFLSGAAALGYEVLWTRLLALALGSETLGMLGVLAGFFGGLALGSWLLHERARRGLDPARLFAGLEAAAAGYALLSPWLLHEAARRLPPLLGPAAGDNDTPLALALSVASAGLLLLPGTLPMGATLAALVEAQRRARPEERGARGVGALYAANTAGATAGLLACVFVVLPRLGLAAGSAVLAALGFGSASAALAWSRRNPLSAPASEPAAPAAPRARLALVAATGFAGIGLEVAAVQVMAQVLTDTVYTFALALAAYLLGTAAGSALFGAWCPRGARLEEPRLTAWLLTAQAASVLVAVAALGHAPGIVAAAAPAGAGKAAQLGAELVLALAVFFVPSAVMGALFAHLLAPLAPSGVGRAYALNTLGGAAAPFFFGVWGLRAAGYAGTLALVGSVYLAAGLALSLRLSRATLLRSTLAALAAGGFLLLRDPLNLVKVPSGWTTRFEKASLLGLVLVTEEDHSSLPDGRPYRRLQVNGRFRMGGSSAFLERRMGHLPLLLAPGARSALFLGVGTGGTVGAVHHFPIDHTDAVELVPEVLQALSFFDAANETIRTDPRVHLHAADARRFLAASHERWDLIVGDLFHPERDGAGSLYALEHFQAAAAHLSEGGVYAQWLPLFQFDLEPLRMVVRTFLQTFPETHSFIGNYSAQTPALVLVGRTGPAARGDRWPLAVSELRLRLQAPIYAELEMQDPRDLLGSYMLDGAGLRLFAGRSPLNTDLHPHVLFEAPHISYERPADQGWRCLQALLGRRVAIPAALLRASAAERAEIAAFARAAGLYLDADIVRSRDGRLSAAAAEGYLDAFLAAPEFGPAAGVVHLLGKQDPAFAERARLRLAARTAPAR